MRRPEGNQSIMAFINSIKTTRGAYHLPEKSAWADRMPNSKEVTVLCDQPDGMYLTMYQTGKRDRRARISYHALFFSGRLKPRKTVKWVRSNRKKRNTSEGSSKFPDGIF